MKQSFTTELHLGEFVKTYQGVKTIGSRALVTVETSDPELHDELVELLRDFEGNCELLVPR